MNKLMMNKTLEIVTNTLRLYINKSQNHTALQGKYKMGGIDTRIRAVQGKRNPYGIKPTEGVAFCWAIRKE